ncbi:MAG: Uma2 family endonuclease, partial [Acidimicrobiales bacterium]
YELSYGTLIVTPAPNTRHQAVMVAIAAFLHQRRLPSLRVLAEAELLIRPDLVKRPDVQVVEENLVGGQSVVGTPSLVVEILSPATRVIDRTEKLFIYAEARIPAYWLVDPDELAITVLELENDLYVERAVLHGDMELTVVVPFSVTIRPSEIFA